MMKLKYLVIILLLSICLVSADEIDYKQKYRDQVMVNIECDNRNIKLNEEVIKLKAKEKAEYLIRIPFTEVGITVEETKGVAVGALSIAVSPIFLIGLLF